MNTPRTPLEGLIDRCRAVDRRFTQTEIARRVKVKQNAVSRWATGESKPQPNRAVKLIGVLREMIAEYGLTTCPPTLDELLCYDAPADAKDPGRAAQAEAQAA